MTYDFWGDGRLYEYQDLSGIRIPTVTQIDQVLDEGNRGEAINREEEACGYADKADNIFEGRGLLRPSSSAAFSSKLPGYGQKPDADN